MSDGTDFEDLLLGLPGFRVTAMTDDGAERLIGIETTRAAAGCPSCGVIARTKDRLRVVIRDLPMFNRRVKLIWSKRRFACLESECPERTWTERSDELPERRVLTARAGKECTRAVGEEARSVASLARMLGVAWSTVMAAVRDYGTPLVDDPTRVGTVHSLGIDETSFLKANAEYRTELVTGFVDLDRRVLIMGVSLSRACVLALAYAKDGRQGLVPATRPRGRRRSERVRDHTRARQAMDKKLALPGSRAFYSRRNLLIEPVFSRHRSASGISRFSCRGLDAFATG